MADYEKTSSGIYVPTHYNYFVKPTEYEMSVRKLEYYKQLAEIKSWGIRNPTKFLKEFCGVELLDSQEYIFMNSWSTPFVLWLESRNAGKDLHLNTKILKSDGSYTTMGEVKVGDYVVDADGNPTKVLAKSPIFTDHKCYEVEFEDGEKIIAGENHLWAVSSNDWKSNIDEYEFRVLETRELAKDYINNCSDNNQHKYRYSVPMVNAINYNYRELPVHPYILGLWLGNEDNPCKYITSYIDDVKELCKHISEVGYQVSNIRDDNGIKKLRIIDAHGKSLIDILIKNRLAIKKNIPNIYLVSSIEQRYELLKGLMDANGSCDESGNCHFSQKSDVFMRSFQLLLDSLGIKNVLSNNNDCSFIIEKDNPCFKLERKKSRLTNNIRSNNNTKSIISIKEVPTVKTQCICVDNPRGLFLCGERLTVTHNSTMIALLLMAKGLLFNNYRAYICSGTANQSQETFLKIESIAKNAVDSMIGLTDYFRQEVVINNATGDGFLHNPQGFKYELFNGSFVKTLNSNTDAQRGKK